jgi:hypothetical protein
MHSFQPDTQNVDESQSTIIDRDLNISFSDKLKHTFLREVVPQQERTNTSIKAESAASDINTMWGGKKLLDTVLQKISQVRSNVLGGNNGNINPSAEQMSSIISKVTGDLRGLTGEVASTHTPINVMETKAISLDSYYDGLFGKIGAYTKITDVAEIFGQTRKDFLLIGYKLSKKAEDPKYIKEISEKTGISEEDGRKLVSQIADLHIYNQERSKQYKEETKSTEGVTMDAMCFYYAKKTLSEAKPEKKNLNNCEKDAIRMIKTGAYQEIVKNKEPGWDILTWVSKVSGAKTPEEIAKLSTMWDESYYGVTIPDALIKDPAMEKILALVEVKTYTPKEVDGWIRLLEGGAKVTKDEFVMINGIQVITMDPEKGIMTWGPDINGERNFAGMVDKTPNEPLPILICLAADTTDKQIFKLDKLTKKAGFTNYAILRSGISSERADLIARNLVKGVARAVEKNSKIDNLDKQILQRLSKG